VLRPVNTINDIIDRLVIFAKGVKKIAREAGTEGNLGFKQKLETFKELYTPPTLWPEI